MLSTAIGVQFKVNDISAKYELIGSSDNYSFKYDLGRGSDLVDYEGDFAQKAIGLRGNYGNFDVRVFAISDIGIRSEFVQSGISVSPPLFDGTFSFSDIKISNLPEDAYVGSSVELLPTTGSNLLAVQSEYVGRNVNFEWRLTPPIGHPQEGESLGNELLSDPLLSHFSLQVRNTSNGDIISDSTLDSTFHRGLQSYLNTASVSEYMSQYTGFSFSLPELSFSELNLDRTLALEVVSHDSFGRTATGVITGTNYLPRIEGLTHSLFGSKVGFAWSHFDTDYESVKIRSLAIPSDQELYDDTDFDKNLEKFSEIDRATDWTKNNPTWREGEYCIFNDSIYECLSGYDRVDFSSEDPSSAPSLWSRQGDHFQYFVDEESVSSNNASFDQAWGWKYYYCFTPYDQYGSGKEYNVTDEGVIEYGGDGSKLYGFVSDVKIDNLNFIEREDDIVFRWNVTDQDNNLVDLNQYKFIVSPNDVPSVLGISGSLFDSETSDFLSGITEGVNSKSSSMGSDGVTTISEDLPGAKVFETFDYTREINNSLYSSGGFPEDAREFVAGSGYGLGENTFTQSQLFTAVGSSPEYGGVPNFAFPLFGSWEAKNNYVYRNLIDPTMSLAERAAAIGGNSIVEYNGSIYAVTGSAQDQIIGPEADNVIGVFDSAKSYSAGDMVIAPNTNVINTYDASESYSAGELVLHQGFLYRALRSQDSSSPQDPASSMLDWAAQDIFSSVDSSIYKSTSSSLNKPPCVNAAEWERQTPETSDEYVEVIKPYGLRVSNYSVDTSYDYGQLVSYGNDIFSGIGESGPGSNVGVRVPDYSSAYWSTGVSDIVTDHASGDIVYHNGAVYRCSADNPTGAPLSNVLGFSDLIDSDYQNSQWTPFWEFNTGFDSIPFRHVGIPESGKRKVGIELGIISPKGEVLSSRSLIGFNLEPSILANGFKVDSLKKVTSTEFNFRYANEAREKVTKLQLYRSSDPLFSILDDSGLPGTGADSFVSEVLGPAEQTFGENINSITDFPPIPYTEGNKPPDSRGDGITGYYYKLLPFDDFGSGDLFTLRDNAGQPERILIYPHHYSNSNPDGYMGPAFGTTIDAIPGPVKNFRGDTAFVNYFLDWEIPHSEFFELSGTLDGVPNDISHYEVWESEDSYLYLGAQNEALDPEKNISGYRKITGDLTSIADEIPLEALDMSGEITNAVHVMDASARSPKMSVSHRGATNDKRNFWIRAVDYGGNKGPFTGKENSIPETIEGLELILGQQKATDIADFERDITATFPNTLALVPNNPFSHRDPTPTSISWDRHFLYMSGEGYVIGEDDTRQANNTDDQYVYFCPSERVSITPSQKEILGLADPGEKVTLFSGSIVANPSLNSFDVNGSPITSTGFSPINSNDDGYYVKFIEGDLNGQEREIDSFPLANGNMSTKRPFVGVPAIGNDFEIVRHVPLTLESNNPLRDVSWSGNYKTSAYHPAGEGETNDPANYTENGDIDGIKPPLLSEGDKIIARNSDGLAVPMWHAFANATIGTAHIQKAAITNAKIHNLTADKIRSAEILSQDIQIGGDMESGQVRSAGFGYSGGKGYDGVGYTGAGFAISGNGSFVFKGKSDDPNSPGGKLYYENGQLTIEGNLKQRDGTDLAVVNMYADPDTFFYDETAGGDFIPSASFPNQVSTIRNSFANSSLSSTDVRYKMELADGRKVFGYDEHTAGVYSVSGFSYNPASDFNDTDKVSSASFSLNDVNNNGFDDILSSYDFECASIVIFASGVNTLTEASVSVDMSIQGPIGETGRSPVYRGVWDNLTCYNGIEDKETLRGDIVYYNNLGANPAAPGGDYYIAKKDSGPAGTCGAGFAGYQQPKSAGNVINSSYWKIFGGQFESVATQLLLSRDAVITDTLTMGHTASNNPHIGGGGTIESAGFIGGLSEADGTNLTAENYNVPGFRLKRGISGSNLFATFDVGGIYETPIKSSAGTPISSNSYIRFSSSTGKIEIGGVYFNGSIQDPNITSDVSLLSSLNGSASNFSSFIGGGINNEFLAPVPGQVSGDPFPSIASAIVGGASNQIRGRFSFIGAGFGNVCKDTFSVICGGHTNSMPFDSLSNEGSNIIGAGGQNKIDGGSNQVIAGGTFGEIEYSPPSVTVATTTGGTAGQSEDIVLGDRYLGSKYILGDGTSDVQGTGSPSWFGGTWWCNIFFTSSIAKWDEYLHGGVDVETWAAWILATNFLGSSVPIKWMYMSPQWSRYSISKAAGVAMPIWLWMDTGQFSGWNYISSELVGTGGDPGYFMYNNTKASWVYVYSGSTEGYCFSTSTSYSNWSV